MKQVLIIHGGNIWKRYEDYFDYLKTRELSLERLKQRDWKKDFQNGALGEGYDVIAPQMPNGQSAVYAEWKLWFERILGLLDQDLILIGHSLGGIFLAKYLAENDINRKVLGTILVAPPFDIDEHQNNGQFSLPSSLDRFASQGGKVFLYFSKDDPVVPFADLAKYEQVLPSATPRVFEDRKHFNQETFPELVADIKALP